MEGDDLHEIVNRCRNITESIKGKEDIIKFNIFKRAI